MLVLIISIVAVFVDSHINQRVVLATTEETRVTQRVSHSPIKCQSRSWSQRGSTTEKVNGSHRDDNPLPKPTQGSKSRQNVCQVQPTDNIGNVSASRRCLFGTKLTFYCLAWCAARISEYEIQAPEKTTKSYISKSINYTTCPGCLPSRGGPKPWE